MNGNAINDVESFTPSPNAVRVTTDRPRERKRPPVPTVGQKAAA